LDASFAARAPAAPISSPGALLLSTPSAQNFDFFANAQFQKGRGSKASRTNRAMTYRPGNSTTVSFGVRYEANPKLVPQLADEFTP